jgi:competence protein ComEA
MRNHRRILAAAVVLSLLAAVAPAFAGEGKAVNVNTASVAELQLLPRIGPAVAARIVEQREKNGPFKALDDLLLVRGIGEATYDQLKPYLALSGPTTLLEKVKLPRAPKGTKSTDATADKQAAKS